MTEEQLLRRILDQPDDNAVRRTYADVLSARGESRGEFIHVACDLAELDDDDPRGPKLYRRWIDLKQQHEASWTASYSNKLRYCFSRGMVNDVWGHARDVLEARHPLFECEPVTELWLDSLPAETVAPLSRLPVFGRIRRLRIAKGECSESVIRTLLGGAGISLRELSLGYGCVVDNGCVAALRALPMWADLEHFKGNLRELSPSSLAQLVEDHSLERLVSLSCQSIPRGTCSVFAERLALPQLTELSIAWSALTEADLAMLVKNPKIAGLKKLRLSRNKLSGVEALTSVSSLEELDLSENPQNKRGTWTVTRLPSSLRSLRLDRTCIAFTGMRRLMMGKFPQLADLGMSCSGLDDDAVQLLAGTRWPLRHLDLSRNPIGDSAVCALAAANFTNRLRNLDLSRTRVDDTAIARIATGTWPSLRKLDLSSTALGERGAMALAEAAGLPQLTRVCLFHVPLSAKALTALKRRFGGDCCAVLSQRCKAKSKLLRDAGHFFILDEPTNELDAIVE